MFKDSKYLLAYLTPVAVYTGLYAGGLWSFGAAWIGFVLIPLAEFFVPASEQNIPQEKEASRNADRFFDFLLYLNLPLVYGALAFAVVIYQTRGFTPLEYIGTVFSLGILLGTSGINVAHELGHRTRNTDRWVARLLLLPALYSHFTIEHNWGHHKHVGTPEDPATARKGESLYHFWIRSVLGSLVNAWKLENKRLRTRKLSYYHHELIWTSLVQVLYLGSLLAIGGVALFGIGLGAGVIGFLLLESVNYIEHYGLLRSRLPSGRFEPVKPHHSWNSNHELGRIFLYELTRHADHHYKTTRHYQILRHLPDSPQLPFGYPASIIMALIPPLWFRTMDPKLEGIMRGQQTRSMVN